MDQAACLSQAVVEGDSFSILSSDADLLLFCDTHQLLLRDQSLPRDTEFRLEADWEQSCTRLQFADICLHESMADWSRENLAELALAFHRMGLDLYENLLTAEERGSLVCKEALSEAERKSARDVDYARGVWRENCLVLPVGQEEMRWDPVRRLLDGKKVSRIRLDSQLLSGESKDLHRYFVAFDQMVLCCDGLSYHEHNSRSDWASAWRAHEWLSENLKKPLEGPPCPFLPAAQAAEVVPEIPRPAPLTFTQNLVSMVGCSILIMPILAFCVARFQGVGLPPAAVMWANFLQTWPRWLAFGVLFCAGFRGYSLHVKARPPRKSTSENPDPSPGCLGCLATMVLGLGLMPYLWSMPIDWNGNVVLMAMGLLALVLAMTIDQANPTEIPPRSSSDGRWAGIGVALLMVAGYFWK